MKYQSYLSSSIPIIFSAQCVTLQKTRWGNGDISFKHFAYTLTHCTKNIIIKLTSCCIHSHFHIIHLLPEESDCRKLLLCFCGLRLSCSRMICCLDFANIEVILVEVSHFLLLPGCLTNPQQLSSTQYANVCFLTSASNNE